MQQRSTAQNLLWPALSSAARPWTRWWWPGSAVNEAEITRQLQEFQAAGFGGVEISPIYGVTGEEARNIDFLSPQWVDMLRHTIREARRMGLDVDLICGTGWPFGGPWVADEDAAARCLFESYTAAEGQQLPEPIVSRAEPRAALQALLAFAPDGRVLDLIEGVNAQGGLDWIAPPGQWRIYALFQAGTGQQVKRAAPGGEGNVVDHFSAAAIARYLEPFEQALAALPADERVRCYFNDSYEVYGANWTAELLPEFERRRGYDLRPHLPALCGQADPDLIRRVRSDYRQTIAELLLHAFMQPWTDWAQRQGVSTRNQAHGAPGNLLDLYAAADIPETETFGTDWLRLAGLDPLPGTPPGHGGVAEVLGCKLASSAAHVLGKPLCSSESFTWLGEHGKVPLAHMQAEVDTLFVMGINHIFFHGTPFSPAAAAWPGWMFYAATHVGPTNPWWRDLPALNRYISRCQSLLQTGRPDNDLLLYWPIFDLWAGDHGTKDLLHFLTPHNSRQWLDEDLRDFTTAARRLWDRGYSFDFVSDRQLIDAIQSAERLLVAPGGTYAALVIAGCTLMPPETLRRVLDLARQGATIVVVGGLPQDVPGLSELDLRRRQLRAALSELELLHSIRHGISEARIGQGRLLVGPDVEPILELLGVRRETIVDAGIELIRRRHDTGYLYFLSNPGDRPLDQWVSLPIRAESALLYDPMHDRQGLACTRAAGDQTQVYLQLAPGESLLLRALDRSAEGPRWSYLAPTGQPYPILGEWRVDFIAGGPTLPAATTIRELSSWTDWPDQNELLRSFSGTARYSSSFEKPAGSAELWALDLGTIAYSAHVTLNGHDLGTCHTSPSRVFLSPELLEAENQLAIEVTNLMANRLAALDRQEQPWRKFFFVDIHYQDFDASAWEPLPSGLLGLVALVPLRLLEPA